MLKCLNLGLKFFLQLAKTFLGIKLLRIKTSNFLGSCYRVKSGIDNTAGCFPLEVWKKIWNWKIRKKDTSFEYFVWRRTKQFGEPTREFLAELPNVFPSQYEQMCRIVTRPKKTFFHTVLPPDMLNAVRKVMLFFADCPNSSSSKR